MIRLEETEDEAALRDLVATVLRDRCPSSSVRASESTGEAPELWSTLVEVGATSLADPEASGGGGAGLSEQAIVAREAGRVAAPVPLVEHLATMPALAQLVPDLHAAVVGDGGIATLCLMPAVDGEFRFVPAGQIARVVVGVADGALVAVRPSGDEASQRNTASQAIATVKVTEPVELGTPSDFERTLDRWKLLTAASLVGIGEAALDLGVDYVKGRRQFGVEIGSFQGVQHGFADLPGELAGAWLLVGKAAWAGDAAGPHALDLVHNEIAEPRVLASMAYLFASEVANHVTDRVLHFHGGYGCAEEYDIQLLYRRARGWPRLLGPVQHERRRLADLLLA